MALSNRLKAEFIIKANRLEEERIIPLISPTIKLVREEAELIGKLKGQLEGEHKVIIRLLNQRVGEIQPPLIELISKLSVKQLEELTDVLFAFSTVGDLEKWLRARPKPVES